jgi:hypothetical protein
MISFSINYKYKAPLAVVCEETRSFLENFSQEADYVSLGLTAVGEEV